MILEGIVTTTAVDGTVNIAPMGPLVPDGWPRESSSFILRPFKTSQTYQNLKALREGVLHVTDDVLLLARAIVGDVSAALEPASRVKGHRLADCCRYYEFRIEELDDAEERTRLTARVVHLGRIRDFFGLNRAKHAVVEAAILASRVHLLPTADIAAEFDRLRPLVDKTGGAAETEAFDLLQRYIESAANRSTSSGE